jgi:Domain of unknown function (DUF3291)
VPGHELAQLNIALMRAPLESPLMAQFVANLDRIYALADHAPGFVWRLQRDGGDATALRLRLALSQRQQREHTDCR